MANQKQDGSNITSCEYSTGRCRTKCEQCFVNFGQQGYTTGMQLTHPDRRAWYDFAVSEGNLTGLWKPPPKQTASERRKYGAKLGSLSRSPESAENIPSTGAYQSWIVKRRKETVKVGDYVFPLFLRVSSMSDSSWAPTDWVVAVREAWGDYCFFNSAIRSVKSRRTNLDEYHKLVTTMNPGMQRLPKVHPTTGLRGWVSVKRDIFKSMGTAGAAKPGDYLHPITLEQAGLKGYESVIKFYRERAVPTVRGRVRTDRPVVVTQMRFNGIAHACEFARRYKLNIEVLVPEHQWSKTGLPPGRIRDIVDVFGTPVYSDPKGSATRVRIWSNKGDRRNTSQHRGAASEYVWYDGFLRVADLSPYDADPYVCDRAHGGCKDCGLCATLDGTQQDWTNWLNVAPWGKVLLPITGPKGAYYTGDALGEGQGQFFNDIWGGRRWTKESSIVSLSSRRTLCALGT